MSSALALKDDKELTKRTIIEAAAAEFLTHGFQATTLDDIARSADVARRTIYHHFDSKKDILFAVCLLQAQEFLEQVKAEVKYKKDFPKYLIDCLIYVIEEAPKSRLFMLDIAQGTGIDPIALYFGNPSLIDDWIELFQEPYNKAMIDRQINPDMNLTKLVNWFGRISTSYLQYPLPGESPEEIRDSLQVFLLSALKFNTYQTLNL